MTELNETVVVVTSHGIEVPQIESVEFAPASTPKARGKGRQDYGTPWEFIEAVERRFGPIVFDLAAHEGNTKCGKLFYGPGSACAEDALAVDWAAHHPTGGLWLNPPFANIDPWASKCAEASARRQGFIFLLTPASIGTGWYSRHVKGKAMVLGLEQRLPFEGMPKNPNTGKVDGYPKDLMLSVYGYGLHGHDTWSWR